MTTRSEREKAQKLNEQHQAILSKMLREEDNKYCADCEAKGAKFTLSGGNIIVIQNTLLTPTHNVASATGSSAKLTCV